MRIYPHLLAITGLAFVFCASLRADIYPRPQVCELGDEYTSIGEINYIKLKSGDTILAEATPHEEGELGSLVDKNPEEGFVLPQVAGAYAIFITDNVLRVYSYDEAGRYYAKQSLSQILKGEPEKEQKNALRDPYPESFNEALALSARLPLGHIIDWPDLPQRGLIEDKNSENSSSWTHESRLEQMLFLGRNKLNSYFILDEAPPYSEEKTQRIVELLALARENHVRLVHGLQWASAESLCSQLELLYELGLRDFALQVLVKEEDRPSAQEFCDLCSELVRDFFDKHEEAAPLQLVFVGDDAEMPKPWLVQIAEHLYSSVGIIWALPHGLAPAAQAELATILGRAPVMMWMPDVAQVELQAIPEGKLGEHAVHEGLIAGVITQQTRYGDHKDIRLFTLADYSWNVDDYKAAQSKVEADKRLEPESSTQK